ncbi:MAG: LON peptidase substrate-binding domain-containing protein [Bdellovibrionales bacterium]
MMERHFLPTFDSLPATLPVFPLSGALLLPRGRLPLNIFEPRYMAMVDDALGPMTSTGRLIGMIQPQTETDGDNTLYRVGCAGRVVAFAETEDHRYLMTLEGIIRFTVAEELPTTRGYRRVVPVWDDYKTDLTIAEEKTPFFSREKLITKLRPYFKLHGILANWETIDELSPEKLVTAVATSCPFTPTEKQALLEAKDLAGRFDLLLALLDMASRSVTAGHDNDGAKH